ncbi:MAG: ribosomal protein S18-alanine N-acetyltransferase [Holosporaceae bacterium]|jgi:ribosomal-protein-alanine N-acetyltransferase|nr:ribosomal protein S18-alanine N-acetyltransferase [Holosporaceae bacterium]
MLKKNKTDVSPLWTSISPLLTVDADVLAQIHAECFRDAWNVESFSSLLYKSSYFGFLLKSSGKPMGFILCNSLVDEIEIITLGVLKIFRNRGCGKYLLKNVISCAEQGDSKKIFLEVSENNVHGISLYESMGFQKIARRKGYYQNCEQSGNTGNTSDALIMIYPHVQM